MQSGSDILSLISKKISQEYPAENLHLEKFVPKTNLQLGTFFSNSGLVDANVEYQWHIHTGRANDYNLIPLTLRIWGITHEYYCNKAHFIIQNVIIDNKIQKIPEELNSSLFKSISVKLDWDPVPTKTHMQFNIKNMSNKPAILYIMMDCQLNK